ncbi:MAG: tetratricopeptide repeat protein [Candidatus Zixiibacteriota bacterium]|nr:MAG: tetratricopeptide repeat protein [candidate division Zixibacteria bacterium]
MTRAPLSARLKVRLARLYQALGKWQESITLVKEVLQVKRHHAEAAYVAGLGMLHLGDSTAAADYFEQSLSNITTEH